jgi:hypothetical protein
MSQRQKQRTNENRAKRLGTGEGISRHGRGGGTRSGGGGVPAWAWVVGGAILVAAIAVVAALVITRGGGSSSSNGQNSSVVKARNSTAKIDWLSQGTWKPNYSNMQAALAALGLTDVAGMSGYTTHYHAHVNLYVNDGGTLHTVPIPQYIGIDVPDQILASIHTHDDKGIIHMESDQKSFKATLQQVFDVWGVRFSGQCVGGYCGGVHMWVNGKPNSQFGSYVLHEHDQVTLLAGQVPSSFTPQKSYNFPAGY